MDIDFMILNKLFHFLLNLKNSFNNIFKFLFPFLIPLPPSIKAVLVEIMQKNSKGK